MSRADQETARPRPTVTTHADDRRGRPEPRRALRAVLGAAGDPDPRVGHPPRDARRPHAGGAATAAAARRRGATATSVPVTVWDPPAWLETLDAGDAVVVVGSAAPPLLRDARRRRGSRVDVEAATIAKATDRRSSRRARARPRSRHAPIARASRRLVLPSRPSALGRRLPTARSGCGARRSSAWTNEHETGRPRSDDGRARTTEVRDA